MRKDVDGASIGRGEIALIRIDTHVTAVFEDRTHNQRGAVGAERDGLAEALIGSGVGSLDIGHGARIPAESGQVGDTLRRPRRLRLDTGDQTCENVDQKKGREKLLVSHSIVPFCAYSYRSREGSARP